MGTRSLKSGADVKRNEALSLNQETAPQHETPSQIQHKTKSTVVKIALLTTLCLENLVVFGEISVLAPFFSTEVSKYGPRLVFICGIIVGSSSLFLFGLGEVIHNPVAFTTVSLFLRIMSAIAGAALQTSKYAIAMEEFPDVLTTAVIGGYKLPFYCHWISDVVCFATCHLNVSSHTRKGSSHVLCSCWFLL
ncbi:unnamed protein product [Porites evermanni]|uniref:Uncharacterized protein n=1 Tax=Porites evermanni TaxID=104178 RepID=A0ABN8RE44_9CNID|nr:unnamed protein product [Porites evermanni]